MGVQAQGQAAARVRVDGEELDEALGVLRLAGLRGGRDLGANLNEVGAVARVAAAGVPLTHSSEGPSTSLLTLPK